VAGNSEGIDLQVFDVNVACIDGDGDGDGTCDVNDNCINVYNPTQEDLDGDGIGDTCECLRANIDSSGIVDFEDYGLLADNWLLTGEGLLGDTNINGIVDINDLEQIIEHWLGCGP
jgi:hypothetical protein